MKPVATTAPVPADAPAIPLEPPRTGGSFARQTDGSLKMIEGATFPESAAAIVSAEPNAGAVPPAGPAPVASGDAAPTSPPDAGAPANTLAES